MLGCDGKDNNDDDDGPTVCPPGTIEFLDADVIFQYKIDLPVSQTEYYNGNEVKIDLDSIAEVFEMSPQVLLLAIEGHKGAPEVECFAIEPGFRDYPDASNTNSVWGHWWDGDSYVSFWQQGGVVFTEFDMEVAAFVIGQEPAALTPGQAITIIEALSYKSIRIAIVIEITVKDEG